MPNKSSTGTEGWEPLRWLWWRFSARRVLHNPLQIIIVVISISLATTLWSAVTRVSLASVSSFEQSLKLDQSGFQIFVSPVGGRFSVLELSPCLASLAPYADVLAIRREAGFLNDDSQRRSVSVVGVSLVASRPVENEAFKSAMYVAPSVLADLGIKEGALLTLQVGEASIEGQAHYTEQFRSGFNSAQVVVPLEQIQGEVLVDTIAIRRSGASAAELARSIAPWIKACVGVGRPLRVETAEAPLARAEQLLAAYRLNILIMAAITLLVCGLLVSQATHLAMRAIVRELSILRTLGVSRRSCFAILVLEASLLSLVGALLGYTAGAPAIVWLTGFLLNTASEIYHIQLGSLGRGAEWLQGVGVALGMVGIGGISAALGAREVLRLPPYRGTRREQVHNAPLPARTCWLVAVSTTVLCCALLLLLWRFESVVIAYLTVGGIVIWAACITPLLLLYAARCIPLVDRVVACWLSRGAIATSGRHFMLSAIAASIAVTLMTGLSLMIFSFRETLTRWSGVRLAGDLFVAATVAGDGNEGRIEKRYLSSIERSPGVRNVLPYYETTSTIETHPVVIGGVDLANQCKRGVYPFLRGGCGDAVDTKHAIVSESASRKLSISVGDAVSVEGKSFPVAGVFQEFGTEQPLIVVDVQQFLRLYEGHNPKTVTIDVAEKTAVEVVRKAIEAIAPENLVVRDHAELLGLVETLFNRTFRVAESVRWIVFSMAMFGLVSTSLQHLWGRRREFKTAQVLGVSRTVLAASIGLEAGIVTLAALCAGVVAGFVVGWCLTEYINPLVFGWSLAFSLTGGPFVEAVAFFALVVVCTVGLSLKMLKRIHDTVRLADE